MPLTPSPAFKDLLSIPTLTGLVRTFADQAQERACTTVFQASARQIKPAGTEATWDEVRYSRHFAPVVGPDGPHPLATLLKPRRRTCTMAWVKAYKDLPGSHLFFEGAPSADTFAHAERALGDELLDLGNLIANTREWLAANALMGLIDVNPRTVPDSDLSFTIDFGNRRADAAASWADDLTKIRSSELLLLKRAFKDHAGLSPGLVIADQGVDGHLTKNLDVRGLAASRLGPVILAGQQKDGKTPAWEGLGGMSWRFTDGTYKPDGGPVTRYFTKDTLVVLPAGAQLHNVLGWCEGTVVVPSERVYTADVLRSWKDLIELERGAYAYAEVRTDPVGIRIYAGWHGLPVVLNPDVLVYRVVPAGSAP